MRRCQWVIAAVIAGGGIGCVKDEGTTLDRDAFYRPPPGTAADRHVLQDKPGPLQYDTVQMDLMDPTRNLLPREAKPSEESVTAISPAVIRAVEGESDPKTPALADTEPSDHAITAPSTTPAGTVPPRPGVSSGVALLVGGVVCEVNGKPIYADKVLASLSKVLAAEAKQRDERRFRAFAQGVIEEQVKAFIRDELEFAVADKNLDPREKEAAREYTARWRKQQITLAGGSVERAKARAAADGQDFEQLVQDQFRKNMVGIYLTKKVLPQAQVRADELRQYYNQNLKSEFTEPSEARFRVIKIDISRTGGEAPALDKINNLHERARRGEDFAAMASSVNDDPSLMRAGGDVGTIPRGAYTLDQLEQGVWKIQPGEVTDIVRIKDAYYIARLESKTAGRVRPFEEEAVQKEIEEKLRGRRIAELRDRQKEILMKDAIIYPFPPDLTPVVEMAMQRYAQWASASR